MFRIALIAALCASGELAAVTPIAVWRLSNLTDSSGNGYTLTNNNSVDFTVIGGFPAAGGNFSTTKYLSAGSSFLTAWGAANNNYQLEAKVYITGVSTVNIFNSWAATTGACLGFSNLNFTVTNTPNYESAGAACHDLTSSVQVSSNAWHDIAVSWDGTTKRLYLDRVLVNSTTTSAQFGATITDFRIGNYANGSYFMTGYLRDVVAWNSANCTGEQCQPYLSDIRSVDEDCIFLRLPCD